MLTPTCTTHHHLAPAPTTDTHLRPPQPSPGCPWGREQCKPSAVQTIAHSFTPFSAAGRSKCSWLGLGPACMHASSLLPLQISHSHRQQQTPLLFLTQPVPSHHLTSSPRHPRSNQRGIRITTQPLLNPSTTCPVSRSGLHRVALDQKPSSHCRQTSFARQSSIEAPHQSDQTLLTTARSTATSRTPIITMASKVVHTSFTRTTRRPLSPPAFSLTHRASSTVSTRIQARRCRRRWCR